MNQEAAQSAHQPTAPSTTQHRPITRQLRLPPPRPHLPHQQVASIVRDYTACLRPKDAFAYGQRHLRARWQDHKRGQTSEPPLPRYYLLASNKANKSEQIEYRLWNIEGGRVE
ncbi:MAG: hypothetical protein ACKPKO_42965, partial [Candidatus Fonsibacter sp.]